MSVRFRKCILPVLAAGLLGGLPLAMATDEFPGGKPNSRVIAIQQKVDDLFEKGDYDRAYFIYHEELAPLGDKHAHYMIGFMHLAGKSVPADPVTASAWYRLAAERGNPMYSKVRDELWQLLNEEQRQLSDRKYQEIRLRYSDAIIVAKLLEEDLNILENRTGHLRLRQFLADLVSYDSEAAGSVQKAIEHIESRLAFLDGALATDEPMSDEEVRRIQKVQRMARAFIGAPR